MRPRFWSRVLPPFLSALFLLNAPVWADVIVLRSGCTIRGTLADREAFADDPRTRPEVAIFSDVGDASMPRLTRVPLGDIDFVVLETNGDKRVFDVGGESGSFTGRAPSKRLDRRFPYTEGGPSKLIGRPTSHRTEGGVALLLLGGAVTFIGAVADFDSPNHVVYQVSNSTGSSNVHYDGRNYALMGIGGVMMLAGLALIASPQEPAARPVSLGLDGERPVLAYRCSF